MRLCTSNSTEPQRPQALWQRLGAAQRVQRLGVGLAWPLAMACAPLLLQGRLNLGCGFLALTGLPCPLCGGTHACAALVQGDVVAAWAANPGVVGLLVVLALLALQWGVEGAAGWRRTNPWPWAGRAAARWVLGGLLLSWGVALLRLL